LTCLEQDSESNDPTDNQDLKHFNTYVVLIETVPTAVA